MCHFITTTLPATASIDAVRRTAAQFGMKWQPLANTHVLAQLDAGVSYFSTTPGQCDCGTVIGSAQVPDRRQATLDNQLRKLRAKRWTQAKIDRWLAQHEKNEADAERRRQTQVEARLPEAERWIEFIRAAITNQSTTRLGLLLHFYRRGPNEDRFTIASRSVVPLGKLTPAFLMACQADVLYDFVRGCAAA